MFEPEELMARIVDLEGQLEFYEQQSNPANSPRADELIACLEGEIAKRDAKYQRDVYGLNNEGDPIGGDPAGGYANDNARLRTERDHLAQCLKFARTTMAVVANNANLRGVEYRSLVTEVKRIDAAVSAGKEGE